MEQLPAAIQALVLRLSGDGHAVWLIGSRANGTARKNSDWDLLVMGDAELLERLSRTAPTPNVDLLVLFDGESFASPWDSGSSKVRKSGSLSDWAWRQTSESEAIYSGTKWPNDWGSIKKAIRLG